MTPVTRFVLALALAAGGVPGAPAETRNTPASRPPVRLAEDYQVLQRGDDDTASFVVKLPDAVQDGAAYKVVAWQELGAADTRLDRAVRAAAVASVGKGLLVEKLPTGGPYTVEVVPDGGPARKTVFRHVLVGDLWLTGGQSNMFGGDLLGEDLPPLPRVNL